MFAAVFTFAVMKVVLKFTPEEKDAAKSCEMSMMIVRVWPAGNALIGIGQPSAALPIRGTASDVVGIIAETRFMKTVSDRRTVTSARGMKIKAEEY